MTGLFFINGLDAFTEYGIYFRKGVFAELLKLPKRKSTGLAHSWPDRHGTERDDTPFFESMSYSLNILIAGKHEGDFWNKYLKLTDFLRSAGYFTLRSEQLNKDFVVLYDEMTAFRTLTPITHSTAVYAEFTLTLINDFTGTNNGGKPYDEAMLITSLDPGTDINSKNILI